MLNVVKKIGEKAGEHLLAHKLLESAIEHKKEDPNAPRKLTAENLQEIRNIVGNEVEPTRYGLVRVLEEQIGLRNQVGNIDARLDTQTNELRDNRAGIEQVNTDLAEIHRLTQLKHTELTGEFRNYHQEIKDLKDIEEMRQKKEAFHQKIQGYHSAFQLCDALGEHFENKTLRDIGQVGMAATQIYAAGAELLASGFALGPAAIIGIAALAIITAFSKKKKKRGPVEDPVMRGLNELSKQLNEVSIAIQERIIHLEENMRGFFEDQNAMIMVQTSLIKTILTDGFNSENYRLQDIQDDLNRITEILKRGFSANYLQDFHGSISEINHLLENNGDRTREFETVLSTVTTWLSEPAFLENINGSWCFPKGLTAETAFNSANLRNHGKRSTNPL